MNYKRRLKSFWMSEDDGSGESKEASKEESKGQEDVQERAATGLATFVVIDDENATVDCKRAEVVMCDGGIRLLLDLARSSWAGLQSEAAKAIANLSVSADVAKSVADEGGINILSNLARSMSKLVAEEAAGGLWNLSVGDEHKGSIAKAGGIKALVDLIFKWLSGSDGVHEGLSETVIEDCESIMLLELSELQNQLKALQRKHIVMLETLRQLECKIEWFHFGYVGLREEPKGKWFSTDCAGLKSHRKGK